MTDRERIEYLEGRVHGLLAVLGALIESHPESSRLISALALCEQSAQAMTEAEPVSEIYLEGLQEIVQKAKGFAAIPQAPKATHPVA